MFFCDYGAAGGVSIGIVFYPLSFGDDIHDNFHLRPLFKNLIEVEPWPISHASTSFGKILVIRVQLF